MSIDSLNSTSSSWTFSDPENVAVFTTRAIVRDGKPILFVTHDEDGSWQFHDGRDRPRPEDAMLAALGEIVQLDPAIKELADLPLGWQAWRNENEKGWHRIGPQANVP